jgi:putative transposase
MINVSDRSKAIVLINEAVTGGALLSKACEEVGITERTYYRWIRLCRETGGYIDRRQTAERPEPANKLTEEERMEIIEVVNQPEFRSSSPCEIVPTLADQGIYIASESTFYRVLREKAMQHHRGRTAERNPRPISSHCATGPNQVWMWDITYLNGPVKGMFYYLYLFSDLFSRKIVAWEVWSKESAEHASQLVRRGIISEKIGLRIKPLVLHSDNGSPMKGATMLETLYRLGITPSNSRPRVSNDNPYAESLFKTLKYNCNYQPKGFKDLEEARQWCKKFVHWYNYKHRHSGINFLTPEQRHSGIGQQILDQRRAVYEAARAKHPERWSMSTRDWTLPDEVWLNPVNTESENIGTKSNTSVS